MPQPADVESVLREAHDAHEHLLIAHANADKGSLDLPNQVVHRDAFVSPCVQPHACWNRLEVAIDRLAAVCRLAGANRIMAMAKPVTLDMVKEVERLRVEVNAHD